MKIGFDNNEARSKKSLLEREKHYRFVINTTLEDYELQKTGTRIGMFDEAPIRTGRIFPSNNAADTLIKKFVETDRYVGKYKGIAYFNFRSLLYRKGRRSRRAGNSLITGEKKVEKLPQSPKVSHVFVHPRGVQHSIKRLNEQVRPIPYYQDRGQSSKCNFFFIQFENEYIEDSDNPQFNKKIYQVVELPEDAILEIEVWDYDMILGDDFIGSAIIDL